MFDNKISPTLHRAAANADPAELKARGLLMIEALILHHQTVLNLLKDEVLEHGLCSCSSYRDASNSTLREIATWSADLQQLSLIESMLEGLNCEFPPTEPVELTAWIEKVNGQCGDEGRAS
jgi:hypothetical protein